MEGPQGSDRVVAIVTGVPDGGVNSGSLLITLEQDTEHAPLARHWQFVALHKYYSVRKHVVSVSVKHEH